MIDRDFLQSILTGAYPRQDEPPEEPDPVQFCEYCSEPSEYLTEIEDNDPSVGYRSSWLICPTCRGKLRMWKANR